VISGVLLVGEVITSGMIALDQGHFQIAFFLARCEGWTGLHKAAYLSLPGQCRNVLEQGTGLALDKSAAKETALQVATSVAGMLMKEPQGAHEEEDEVRRRRALETIDILEHAAAPWKPKHNLLFPPEFRSVVVGILMMRRSLRNTVVQLPRKRSISELPLELWHMIIAWIPHDAFSPARPEYNAIQSKVAEIASAPQPTSILAAAAAAVAESFEEA